ncbi:MAG TPA: hypothetical protein VKA53_07570 [Thermoanaerobaculia bacterium]|nr:hypothetical protein [Thermoanaerobaculia bacterium]
MLKRFTLLTAFFTLFALPAMAVVHYKAVTKSSANDGKTQQNITVEAWAEGPHAKILFTQSDNPFMQDGSYLLTNDAGHTVYLVNPKDKTYMKWDLDSMFGALGGLMKGVSGFMHMKISDPKVVKLSEESGGAILGMPTTHTRYRTTYTMSMSVFRMKRSSEITTTQDLWTTKAVSMPALGVWLRKTPPKTGDEQIDKLVKSQMHQIEGVPLKTITHTVTREQNGKQTESDASTVVTEFSEHASAPSGGFKIPSGYSETSMSPQMQQQGNQDQHEKKKQESPLKRLFGGGGE